MSVDFHSDGLSRSEALGPARHSEGILWGLVVTYRRPIELALTLKGLAEQTRQVDRLVVVDNGSSVDARDASHSAGARYLDAGDNLGPAGGIAFGMQHVLDRAGPDDWLILIDDDDPPRDVAMVERLLHFGRTQAELDPHLAGVGLAGARYDRRWGVVRRLPDGELVGPTKVDYIGGNQFPTLRCCAIREVGVFDSGLFFGFEELEYGLRLGSARYSLYVDGEVWRASRLRSGRINYPESKLRTPKNAAAWRRYYNPRNATLIAKRYGRPWAPLVTSIAGGMKGALVLARERRPVHEIWLPILGAAHGLLGKSGRIVDPGPAQKVN